MYETVIRTNNPDAIISVRSPQRRYTDKLSVSRRWNSMPEIRKMARFGSIWTLSSKLAKNKSGQPYYNFDVEFAGFPDDALYQSIKRIYGELGLENKTH